MTALIYPKQLLLVVAISLLTAACNPMAEAFRPSQKASAGFRYLELVRFETFESAGDWSSYDAGDSLYMAVEDGAYQIRLAKRQFVWAQAATVYQDIVLEVEVQQLSAFKHNAFGIACRLDPGNSGRGYYFLISGDGHYSIRWSNGRSLDDIVPAKPTDKINRGQASNRIRAVCIEDHLSLWINDHFVADARDHRASGGAVGLTAVMNYQGKRVDLAFDDLKIWLAALDE